eukprot:1382511-Amphidinium_carterae.1
MFSLQLVESGNAIGLGRDRFRRRLKGNFFVSASASPKRAWELVWKRPPKKRGPKRRANSLECGVFFEKAIF